MTIDELCGTLGIPARIFKGEDYSSLQTEYKQYECMRLEGLRKRFTDKIINRILEDACPDLFWGWKPFFLFSPRGQSRIRVRRKPPEITYEST